MQQPLPPSSSPSFGQVVLGTMLGNLGCFLAYLALGVCVAAVFGAAILGAIQDNFGRLPLR